MRELTLEETKCNLLEIMIAFDKYCYQNNLRYYLCGGALIGAIRHKGFIPWDDDIDVIMPRPDYEKLIEIEENKKIGKTLELFNYRKKNSNLLFTKLGDTSTEVYNKYQKEKEYLSIDIFPIDGMSNNEKLNKKNYQRVLFLRTIYALHLWRPGNGTSRKVVILKSIFYPFAKLISHQYICKKIERIANKFSFEQSELIGDIIWGYGEKEIVNKENFLKQIEVPFENYWFKTTKIYDEYLKNVYGDYMKLPPEEKRRSHELLVYKKEEL